MSRWLRLTTVRLAIALAVSLAVIELLVWYPTKTARDLVASQISLTQGAQQRVKTADNLLNILPDLGNVPLGQPAAAEGYAQQAAQASNGFKQFHLVRPQPVLGIFGIHLGRKSKLIADVNNLIRHKDLYFYRTGNSDIQQADRLMHYHQQVSQALVNLLGYNAAADMAGFSLNSADSQNRITLAQQGLAKTAEQLQAAKPLYNDPSIADLTKQVDTLSSAINGLDKNGDANAWIASVNSAQAKIVANRTAFWNTQKKTMQIKLTQDIQDLLQLNTDWRRVASQNNI